MKTKITFEEYLKKDNLAENSIESYLWTVNYLDLLTNSLFQCLFPHIF